MRNVGCMVRGLPIETSQDLGQNFQEALSRITSGSIQGRFEDKILEPYRFHESVTGFLGENTSYGQMSRGVSKQPELPD